jgi:uncharacterized protein YxjI
VGEPAAVGQAAASRPKAKAAAASKPAAVNEPESDVEETAPAPKPSKKKESVKSAEKKAPAPKTEDEEGNSPGLLDNNLFVVKEHAKLLSSKKSYDIVDENGEVLGTAKEKAGWLGTILGALQGDKRSITIEVRQSADDALAFTVRRKGLLFKKTQVLDGDGQVLGTYKAKLFTLTGGFNVYDLKGTHIAGIKGQWFKAEYQIVTPDGSTVMGSVSRKFGGLAKELFTDAKTYGVQIGPDYHDDPRTKILVLGAAIVINVMSTKKKAGKSGGDEEISVGGGEE